MRRKTRSAHNLDAVSAADEGLEDPRLARRLKRRFMANQEFKRLRTDSKVKLDKSHNSIPKAKAKNVVIDNDDQEFKRLRTDSQVKLDKSHSSIPKAKAKNVVIDNDDKELEDADYIQYLNDLSSQTVDDLIVSNNKSFDDGNIAFHVPVEGSVDYVDTCTNNDTPIGVNSIEISDYRDHLADDSDHSVDDVHINIVDTTNPVNQPMGNCSSGNFSTENVTADGGFVETSSQSIGADGDDYLDEMDPHYKTFLDNVIEIGTSYALEIPGCDGISEILTYEEYEKDDDHDAASVAKHVPKHKMKCDELDSCYSNFLDSLKKEGKNLVLMLENGGKVVYEEDEESSSDSEVIVMDADPFANENCTPFVTSKGKTYDVMDEDDGYLKSCSNEQSWFREKLVEILKKPFDEKEYHELLSEVRQHKPVKEERDMRNGRTRVFLSHKIAPSYCDLHKDLETSIMQAKQSKPKILNILRGFFYWLQNVVHDGVFKPWTDSSCLEVLPSVPSASFKSN